MFLSGTMSEISIADAGVIAVLGYAVVFFGLILLMLVVMALGKAFSAMAIVAHTLGKPLNELRFISIKEVK